MFFRRKRKSERRQARRIDVPVFARIVGKSEGYRRVLDIGITGLRMTTNQSLTEGEWIPVSLQFPDLGEEMSILGRVAWTEETGEFGLDYSQLSEEQAGLLDIIIGQQEVLTDITS